MWSFRRHRGILTRGSLPIRRNLNLNQQPFTAPFRQPQPPFPFSILFKPIPRNGVPGLALPKPSSPLPQISTRGVELLPSSLLNIPRSPGGAFRWILLAKLITSIGGGYCLRPPTLCAHTSPGSWGVKKEGGWRGGCKGQTYREGKPVVLWQVTSHTGLTRRHCRSHIASLRLLSVLSLSPHHWPHEAWVMSICLKLQLHPPAASLCAPLFLPSSSSGPRPWLQQQCETSSPGGPKPKPPPPPMTAGGRQRPCGPAMASSWASPSLWASVSSSPSWASRAVSRIESHHITP